MRKKAHLLKIVFFFLIVLLSTSISLAQDSLDTHFTPEDLPFKDQKRRLDRAAQVFALDSSKIIILLGYNKKGRKKSTAIRRLRKSKEYLMSKHKIPSNKIRTAYVGVESGLQIKIYIVDPDTLDTEKPN